jgi:hypothetical protein
VVLAAVAGTGCFTTTNMKTAGISPGFTFAAGATSIGGEPVPVGEARLALLPGWDLGARLDFISMVADTRIQFLTEERHRLDGAVELGVGSSFGVLPRPFYCAGVMLSKRLDGWTPYFLARYIDIAGLRDDVADEDANIVVEILLYMPPQLDDFVEYFLGAEVKAGEHLAFVFEVMTIPELEDQDGDPPVFLNAGVRFGF